MRERTVDDHEEDGGQREKPANAGIDRHSARQRDDTTRKRRNEEETTVGCTDTEEEQKH